MAGNHYSSDPLCHSFNFNAFDGHDHSKNVGEPLRGMNPSMDPLMDGHRSSSSQDVSTNVAVDGMNVAYSYPLATDNDSLAVPATASFANTEGMQFGHGFESDFGDLNTLLEGPGDALQLPFMNIFHQSWLPQTCLSAGRSSCHSMLHAPTPADNNAMGLYRPSQASINGPQDSLSVIHQPGFLAQATPPESNLAAECYFGMQPLATQAVHSGPFASLDPMYQPEYLLALPTIPIRSSSDTYAPIKLPQLLPMGPGAAVYVGRRRRYTPGYHRTALETSSILPRVISDTSGTASDVLPHVLQAEGASSLSRQVISGSPIGSRNSSPSKATNVEEDSSSATTDAASARTEFGLTVTPGSVPLAACIPLPYAPKQTRRNTKRTAATRAASTTVPQTQRQAVCKQSVRKSRSSSSKANVVKPAGTRATKGWVSAAKKPSTSLPCDFPGCTQQSCDERSLERHKATHTRTAADGWYCPGMLSPPGKQETYRKCTCPPLGYIRNDPLKRHLDKMIRACPSSPCVVEGLRWGYDPRVKGSIKNLWRFKPYLQVPAT